MKKYFVFLLMLFVLGCAHTGGQAPPSSNFPSVGVDPTLTWTAPTTDCTGVPFSGTVTYNVYHITGAGPIPTVPISTIPCGTINQVDVTKVTKDNTTPITGTSFNVILGNGTYTAAVEAVDSAGNRAGFTSVTFTVLDLPGAATGLKVAGLDSLG